MVVNMEFFQGTQTGQVGHACGSIVAQNMVFQPDLQAFEIPEGRQRFHAFGG